MRAMEIAIVTVAFVVGVVYGAILISKSLRRSRISRLIDKMDRVPDERFRSAAITELGRLDIGNSRIVDAFQDSSAMVRNAAQECVTNAAHKAIEDIAEARHDAKMPVASILTPLVCALRERSINRKLDKHIVPSLIALATDGEGHANERAIALLRQICTPLALAALRDLSSKTPPASTYVAAHYPNVVRPTRWEPLLAYIYKHSAADAVSKDLAIRLGKSALSLIASHGTLTTTVLKGTEITARPSLAGFRVNPPEITIAFQKPWHCLAFEIEAPADMLGGVANGAITFTANGLVVADIPLSLAISDNAATEIERHESPIYQTVFCSYSHKDEEIAIRVESAARSLGMRYLRDQNALRSGEQWSDALLRLIEDADVFQLLWSSAAAQSMAVKREWEHALKQARSNNFIRPVYWSRPLPPPPAELTHIHFCFEPRLKSEWKETGPHE